MIHLKTPITKEMCKSLKVGDRVFISGTLYTARDAAHKRLYEMLENKERLPLELKDICIYYVGPTPTPPNKTYGSAGPTTSSRMDAYAPVLYDLGVNVTIGKGYRNNEVQEAIIRNQGCYMVAIGGAGALLGKCVKKATPIAFEDLGAEAIVKLEVENFPVTVAMDCHGNDIYK